MTKTFAEILERAAERHGGEDVLRSRFSHPGYDDGVEYGSAPYSDDRWLANFTMRIFQAGFNWNVIVKKWPGFEEAFGGFAVETCANIGIEEIARLSTNAAIVRNPKKIRTIPVNAQMILDMRASHGGVDSFVRSWPSDDFVGLLEHLQKHGSHLGIGAASYSLRTLGVPSFILSKDVTAALIDAGVIHKPATSKTAKRAIQKAFNQWREESGDDLTFISRVLAHSIDG